MAKPRIVSLGTNVYGVILKGDPNDPEKESFRVSFPFGDVDVMRTTDDQYWVHVRVNREGVGTHNPDDPQGVITGGRLDLVGRHTNEVDLGEFDDPDLYHLAVQVGPRA